MPPEIVWPQKCRSLVAALPPRAALATSRADFPKIRALSNVRFPRYPRRGGREQKTPSRKRIMARQFIYHMEGLSKTYPGNRKVLENINLSFYPDAKIGVLGVNGSGKSTLLRVMPAVAP